jgi:hypothetical protein
MNNDIDIVGEQILAVHSTLFHAHSRMLASVEQSLKRVSISPAATLLTLSPCRS